MLHLVTGHAGFIGFHTACRLLERGDGVIGLDNLNDYYDPALKQARLAALQAVAARSGSFYRDVRANLADAAAVDAVFAAHRIERVINLAAQAGVRYSLQNPRAYVESNISGFVNLLEACRQHGVGHLSYASTSSVYGASTALPYSEHVAADHPLQFYAATKRANELMAHAYSHLYRLPTTGLRFFTVYGPWGRPDMAPFLFTRAILEGRPIQLFNHGRHSRDFTFVGDIVEGVLRASDRPAAPDPAWTSAAPDPARSNAPWRVYNLGASAPVALVDFIDALEAAIGKPAIRELAPLQPGDVPDTAADTTGLQADVGYAPATPLREGVQRFVDWYRGFYKV